MSPPTQLHLRHRILRLSHSGQPSRAIATSLGIGKSTVNYTIAKFKSGRGLHDLPRSGRPRKTSPRLDNKIYQKSAADVRKNAADISRELAVEGLAVVSPTTVARRLREKGLYGRIGVKKPLISPKNRRNRLIFAEKHLSWTIEDWEKVLFSDESKFSLFGSDGRLYVRRPKGARYNCRYQTPTVKHGGGNVMVWGCFSSYGVGPLVDIPGTMDSCVYKDILEKEMLPYATAHMPRGWIYQHDNDPKHASRLVKEWITSKRVRILEWPSQSPDLNPIEHVWNELGRKVGRQKHRNRAELLQHLREEWAQISPAFISNLIQSMPQRCAAVKAAKGFSTKY